MVDEEVRELMDRISLMVDEGRDRAYIEKGVLGVRVEAELLDGGREIVEIKQPRGHPEAPFGEEDVVGKLGWLVGDAGKARRLMELCMGMSTAGGFGGVG